MLRRHHHEVVEIAAEPEPVLADGDRIGIALDQRGKTKPLEQRFAQRHAGFSEDRTVPHDAGRMFHDTRQSDTETLDPIECQPGVGNAAPDAVLHEIGDDFRRLSIDPHRLGQSGQHVALEIGDHMHDPGRRDLHADDARSLRVERQQDSRAAAAGIPDRAHLAGNDQPVIQQSGGDSGDRGRAEFGPFADLHSGDRSMPPDRVHHVEAIDRTHKFRIGGLHRAGVVYFGSVIYSRIRASPVNGASARKCRIRPRDGLTGGQPGRRFYPRHKIYGISDPETAPNAR
jgi:hypothetical protein